MIRWTGFVLLVFASGCMEEFYLEPYPTPETPAYTASCGGQPPLVRETQAPPLAQNSSAPLVQTYSLPAIRNTGEPELASPAARSNSGWMPQ